MKRVPITREERVREAGALRAAMRRTAGRAKSGPTADCTCSPARLQTLNRIARRLGINAKTLHDALHEMPMARSVALNRVDRVTTGLARQLGGNDILRKWAHTPITAFGNRKPVDVLAEGRVEPLERLEAVLEAGVYS
jgi:hypothetical protein